MLAVSACTAELDVADGSTRPTAAGRQRYRRKQEPNIGNIIPLSGIDGITAHFQTCLVLQWPVMLWKELWKEHDWQP